jgi:hypothetical protein
VTLPPVVSSDKVRVTRSYEVCATAGRVIHVRDSRGRVIWTCDLPLSCMTDAGLIVRQALTAAGFKTEPPYEEDPL